MINRVILVGRLVRDPELRKVTSGNSVSSFTIAIDNWTKDANGNKTTSFIPCVVWGLSADNVSKYARKGMLVGVDGRLSQRKYDRKDGTKASVIEIICDSVQFLEPKDESAVQNQSSSEFDISQDSVDDSKNLDSIDIPDDDLPF